MYVLPNFNLLCRLWSWPAASFLPAVPAGAPRLSGQECALVYGRRTNQSSTGGTSEVGVLVQGMNLLLPSLTDVRGPQDVDGEDVVECPQGSGRFYRVTFVDDIGKGYPNEHRTATLLAAQNWIPPYG